MANASKKEVNEKENIIEVKEIKMEEKECFVIMPIGDHASHQKGHFKRVYEDILKPAIEEAGFIAYRADDNGGSQNIQIDIIKKIIEAPMAVCDLSTRNPNVLFELGVRQAFDKPVALIQEIGTERIFDISNFNTIDYRSERIYHEVIEDRRKITSLIYDTYRKHSEGVGVNSIIKLISAVNAAKISDKDDSTESLIKMMFNEVNTLSRQMQFIQRNNEYKLYIEPDKNVNIKRNYDLITQLKIYEKTYRIMKNNASDASLEDNLKSFADLKDDIISFYKTIDKRKMTMAEFKVFDRVLDIVNEIEDKINNKDFSMA